MTRRSSQPVYLIELQGTSDRDIHALRALLKALGRWHGLRCLSARETIKRARRTAVARVSTAATKEANMAIGRRKTDGALNKLNWDFRIGKSVLEDRVRTGNGWETEQRNVETDEFRAVFDPENIEVGWIAFVKGEGLNAKLVHVGEDYGDRPSNDHKEGLRIVVKMDPALGGDLRELISTSSALWAAVDQLPAIIAPVSPSTPTVCRLSTLPTCENSRHNPGRFSSPRSKFPAGCRARRICRPWGFRWSGAPRNTSPNSKGTPAPAQKRIGASPTRFAME